MEKPKKFDVFISYHSSDKPWVLKLKSALESHGLHVWLDRDEIRPGDMFAKALESGLKASKSIILVVTTNSMKSKWVDEEYYRALSLSNSKKQPARIIPIVLNTTRLPGFLQSRNWVDFRDETEFEQNIDKLVWGVKGKKENQPDLHEEKHSDKKTLADRLFSEALKLNFGNYPLKALQKFRQVKEICPDYTDIDFWIQKLEEEEGKNLVDQSGRVSFDRLRMIALAGVLVIVILLGVKFSYQYVVAPTSVATFTPVSTLTQTATITPTVTATRTMTPSPTPTPTWTGWKILLQDDFADNTNNGCLPITTYKGDLQGNTSIVNKEYVVEGTRLKADGSAVWQVLKLDCQGILSDFYMKVDVRFNSLNPDTTIGLAFGSNTETSNYYLFEFKNNGDYRTRIYSSYSGENLNGDYKSSLAIKSNDWNTIQAVKNNNKIDIYVNDQYVTDITDLTYNSGYLGLFIRLTNQNAVGTWEFDNLEVRSPQDSKPPEPTPSTGYTIYDNFNADNGAWKISGNEAKCPRSLEDGILKIECFGSATDGVDLTLFPTDLNVLSSQGIEMAFYTLPQLQGTNQWGKYHIQTRFGSSCDDGRFPRTYSVSMRPNELTFIETDGNYKSINPPSPTKSIGTLETHIVKIEFLNGEINYYLDDVLVRNVSQYEDNMPVCWMFQSEDNANFMSDGYRGIAIIWIATKP